MSGSGTPFVLSQSRVRTEQATTTSQAFPLYGMYPGCSVTVDVLGLNNVGVAFGDATVVATNTGTGNARSYQFKAGCKETVTPAGATPPTYFAIISVADTSDVQVTVGSGA